MCLRGRGHLPALEITVTWAEWEQLTVPDTLKPDFQKFLLIGNLKGNHIW